MTVALNDKDVITLVIPKTASTWRMRVYEALGINAFGYAPTTHEIKIPLECRFAFTFVRHPVTWLQSRYYMGVVGGPGDPLNKLFDGIGNDLTWPRFLEGYFSYPRGTIGEYFSRYTNHCQFVGRFENVQADTIRALRDSKIRFDADKVWAVPPLNRTNVPKIHTEQGLDPNCTYEDKQINKVCDLESKLIRKHYA